MTNTYPVGARAVPDHDSEWDYNNNLNGIIIPLAKNRFITCLLASLRRAALKAVKYKKV